MYGGGIMHHQNASTSLVVASSRIESNQATSGGGAYAYGLKGAEASAVEEAVNGRLAMPSTQLPNLPSPPTITMIDTTLSGNTAHQSGGGLNLDSVRAVLVNLQLESNKAQQQGFGGGMRVRESVAWVQGAQIQSNTAKVGAGVHIAGPAYVSFDQIQVHGNDASEQGGGISAHTNPVIDVVNCTFTENTSPAGSQLYNADGNVTLSDGTSIDGSDNAIFNGLNLHYILPAPLGHYLPDVFTCAPLYCGASLVVAGEQILCSRQRCDYGRHPSRNMTQSIQGSISGPYPPLCEAGYFGNSAEAAAQNSATCAGPCPLSHYCPLGTVLPVPCSARRAGGYTLTTGARDPNDCSQCVKGKFLVTRTIAASSAQMCDPCPANATTQDSVGATNSSDCKCKPNFYATGDADDGSDCVQCPPGAWCNGTGTTRETLSIKAGYWRPSILSLPKECPTKLTCLGGINMTQRQYDNTSNATCERGLQGAYCRICADEKSIFNDKTNKPACVTPERTRALLVVLGFLLTGILVGYLRTAVKAAQPANGGSAVSVASKAALLVQKSARVVDQYEPCAALHRVEWVRSVSRQLVRTVKKFVAPLKMMISFYQVRAHASQEPSCPPPPTRPAMCAHVCSLSLSVCVCVSVCL